MPTIALEFVRRAIQDSAWDIGNQALYELCRKHPEHRSEQAILAKVWLIGRSYAASIERRRDVRATAGDDFYRKVVVPKVQGSDIDAWFQSLRGIRVPSADVVVPVHGSVTKLFSEISGLEKRSLASKYLHFHFPRAVYIYDARAVRALREAVPPLRMRGLGAGESDREYARFFHRCARFHAELEQRMGRTLSPREVDKVLLAIEGRT